MSEGTPPPSDVLLGDVIDGMASWPDSDHGSLCLGYIAGVMAVHAEIGIGGAPSPLTVPTFSVARSIRYIADLVAMATNTSVAIVPTPNGAISFQFAPIGHK